MNRSALRLLRSTVYCTLYITRITKYYILKDTIWGMTEKDRREILKGIVCGAVIGVSGCSEMVGQEEVGAVDIRDDRFDPCNLDVPEETTVMWENQGDRTHTVTSVSDNWDVDTEVDPGGALQNTFNRKGVYDAVCTTHGSAEEFTGMRMRIVVGDAETDGSIDC